MLKLFKLSAPGWEKEFDTRDELRTELYSHICQACRDGEQIYKDGKLIWDEPPVPPEATVGEMLWSPCGCEFDVEGLENDKDCN